MFLTIMHVLNSFMNMNISMAWHVLVWHKCLLVAPGLLNMSMNMSMAWHGLVAPGLLNMSMNMSMAWHVLNNNGFNYCYE